MLDAIVNGVAILLVLLSALGYLALGSLVLFFGD